MYQNIGDSLAGGDSGALRPLLPGQVAYITTGAPVPEGADAVVPIEDTRPADGGRVEILSTAVIQEGIWIRPIGCDISAGSLVLRAGTLIGPTEIGLLATLGVGTVRVIRKPRVGVLSTGDEVLDLSAPSPSQRESGKIFDSNRPVLLSLLRRSGFPSLDLGIARDREEELRKSLWDGLEDCDVVLVTGGVSMGRADLLKPLLQTLGEVHFGRVCMKPGKPTTFATIQIDGVKKLVFGLPGNPVSAQVCFELFAKPALNKLGGIGSSAESHGTQEFKDNQGCVKWSRDSDCNPPTISVHLTENLALDPARPEYHRALVFWDPTAQGFKAISTGVQRSSRLLSMAGSNALLCLPQSDGLAAAGTIVDALLLGNLPSNARELAKQLPSMEEARAKQPRKVHSCGRHHGGRGGHQKHQANLQISSMH